MYKMKCIRIYFTFYLSINYSSKVIYMTITVHPPHPVKYSSKKRAVLTKNGNTYKKIAWANI